MAQPDPSPRTPAQREADHAAIAQLSDALLPALVQRLNASGLGELEVREGDWSVRLRRPPASGSSRRGSRGGGTGHAVGLGSGHAAGGPGDGGRPGRDTGAPPELIRSDGPPDPGTRRVHATAPAVGIFRPGLTAGARVRAGDRIAVVDLLGVPQDVVAPIDGMLVEVFVQGGEAVEYGEEVAAVEPEAETGSRAGASS